MNQLTGTVPPEFQNLADNLTSLLLHDNGFAGSLDEVFCDSMDEIAFELEAHDELVPVAGGVELDARAVRRLDERELGHLRARDELIASTASARTR